jgi:hypothetical protein
LRRETQAARRARLPQLSVTGMGRFGGHSIEWYNGRYLGSNLT